MIPKPALPFSRAREALEHDVHRGAGLERAHLGGDMAEHAVLRRHAGAIDDVGGEFEQAADVVGLVDARVDSDERVAGRVREAFVSCGCDSGEIVARMVWLQAGREPAREAERGARVRDDANLRRNRNQIEIGAQLGDRGGDFGGDSAAGCEDRVAGGRVVEQPFAKLADRLAAHGGECVEVERVIDNARHLVAIVGDDRILAQIVQREIGEHGFGCDSFLLGARRDSRQLVARARFVGAREQFLDGAEAVGLAEQSGREFHPAAMRQNEKRERC